jgi:hypothetical protein
MKLNVIMFDTAGLLYNFTSYNTAIGVGVAQAVSYMPRLDDRGSILDRGKGLFL